MYIVEIFVKPLRLEINILRETYRADDDAAEFAITKIHHSQTP